MWKGRWRQGSHIPLVRRIAVLWWKRHGRRARPCSSPLSPFFKSIGAGSIVKCRRGLHRCALQQPRERANWRSTDTPIVARRCVPRGMARTDSSRDVSDPPVWPGGPFGARSGGSLTSRLRVRLRSNVRGVLVGDDREIDRRRTREIWLTISWHVRTSTVMCRPSRTGSSRCARRGQCLGAARRPRSVRDAASGIDRASAQRVIWHLRDGRIEWLTLTTNLAWAYSADISLVSV